MRLVSFYDGQNRRRAGRVEGEDIVELPFADVGELLAAEGWEQQAAAGGDRHPLAATRLAPVVPSPGKIICLGLNYLSHIQEMGRDVPKYPTLFAKYAGALIGPKDPITLPVVSEQVDWEAELAFVIGRPARHVAVGAACEHIAGWTCMNDITVRDWQHRTREFLAGKTFEGSTPLGPALVTRDEGGTDGLGLRIECRVDGQVVQSGNTDDLIFTPAQIVAYVSQIITLEPGDVIATGTTGGVAASRNPPPWLRAGQVVTVWIEGIGELVNPCRPEQ